MRQVAIVIGRFQPVHNGHLSMIKQAMNRSDLTIIAIGSAACAPDIKNPWSVHDRVAMLSAGLGNEAHNKIKWVSVLDHPYDDNAWLKELKIKIKRLVNTDDIITLIGHQKDESMQYLKWFPDWLYLDVGQQQGGISATEVRESIFKNSVIHNSLPEPVKKYLELNWMHTEEHVRLTQEYVFVEKEHNRMEKHKTILSCADAVITRPGQVLTITRKNNHYGFGLRSLPGVVARTDERMLHAAIRAAYEKAGIVVREEWMKKYTLFDKPDRSLAGRRISHSFRFDVPEGWEHKDQTKSEWIDIADIAIYSEEFFEDHVAIIEEMIK